MAYDYNTFVGTKIVKWIADRNIQRKHVTGIILYIYYLTKYCHEMKEREVANHTRNIFCFKN